MHGIDLEKLDGYTDLKTAIDVRNSIAHRLGRFRHDNPETLKTRRAFEKIGVHVYAERIVISDLALKQTAASATTFITAVDEQADLAV